MFGVRVVGIHSIIFMTMMPLKAKVPLPLSTGGFALGAHMYFDNSLSRKNLVQYINIESNKAMLFHFTLLQAIVTTSCPYFINRSFNMTS